MNKTITREQIIGELNHQIDVCQSRNEPYNETSWNEDDMIGVLITQNMAAEIVWQLNLLDDIYLHTTGELEELRNHEQNKS
jgi:hypothetical protein